MYSSNARVAGAVPLGMIQEQARPSATLVTLFLAGLQPRRVAAGLTGEGGITLFQQSPLLYPPLLTCGCSAVEEDAEYAATVTDCLAHMLPAIVHSYINEFLGDCAAEDALRRGRAKDKAMHKDIVDFMKTAAAAFK